MAETLLRRGRRRRRSRARILAEKDQTPLGSQVKLTRQQVAFALQISPFTLRETYSHFIPEELLDTTQRPTQYDLRVFGCVLKGVTHEIEESYKGEQSAGEPGALERKRLVQTRVAELDLEIKRGTFLKKQAIVTGLDRFVATMRRYGDRFRNIGDPLIIELFNEMIDEAKQAAQSAVMHLEKESEEDSAWVA